MSPGRMGFNPCFNGSVERGDHDFYIMVFRDLVSILVLMEVLREGDCGHSAQSSIAVSILVLMEVLREARSVSTLGR